MLTNIYFVRHAHSEYTPDELGRPLSVDGTKDVATVRDILENENIDMIISSPYKRAIQTVEGIANHLGKKIIIENDLRERTLSGIPVKNFPAAINKVWSDPTFSFKGGESNVVAQERGVFVVKKILRKFSGKNIVIGTHGNIMVLIMNYFDKDFDFEFWQSLNMPDIYQLTFDRIKLTAVKQVWNGI